MERIRIKIQGVSPLLMHGYPIDTSGMEHGTTRKVKTSTNNKTPREAAEGALYNQDGKPYIPGMNLYAAIIGAGKFHKVGRAKLTTAKTSLIPAGLWIVTEVNFIDGPSWEVDSRIVVNQNTGQHVVCHRPRFDKWQAQFELEYDPDMFDESLVRQLVDDAGAKLGLMAFRPERKGPFGRFKVIHWAVQK